MKNVTFQLINQLKLEDRMNDHSSAVRSRCRPTSQIEFSDVRIHGIMALGTHPPPEKMTVSHMTHVKYHIHAVWRLTDYRL